MLQLVILLLVIVAIATVVHAINDAYWSACAVAAVVSAVAYIILAFIVEPAPGSNEMFGAGIIEVGLFGFIISMVIGIPFLAYRRSIAGGSADRPEE